MLPPVYCLPFCATALPLFKIYMLLSGYCLPFYVTALLLFEALPLFESFPSWSLTFCSIHHIKFLSWYLCTFHSRPGQYLQYLFSAPNTRRVQAAVLARAIIPIFTVHFTAASMYPSSTDRQTKLYCSCIHVTCGCVHTLLTDCSLQGCRLCR